MTLHTGVALVAVSAADWYRPDGRPYWPRLIDLELMQARRLAKGVDLKEVRLALLDLAGRVWQAAEECRSRQWRVPPDLLPGWHELLARLAFKRGTAAAVSTGRQQCPLFLPCLFAPPQAHADAGAYGSLTVTAHVRELEALREDSAEPALLAALDERQARFRSAETTESGVLEWVIPDWEARP